MDHLHPSSLPPGAVHVPILGILGRLEKHLRHDANPAFGAMLWISYDGVRCRWLVEWDTAKAVKSGIKCAAESDDLAVAIDRLADLIEQQEGSRRV